jgi:hypothetical protein
MSNDFTDEGVGRKAPQQLAAFNGSLKLSSKILSVVELEEQTVHHCARNERREQTIPS